MQDTESGLHIFGVIGVHYGCRTTAPLNELIVPGLENEGWRTRTHSYKLLLVRSAHVSPPEELNTDRQGGCRIKTLVLPFQ